MSASEAEAFAFDHQDGDEPARIGNIPSDDVERFLVNEIHLDTARFIIGVVTDFVGDRLVRPTMSEKTVMRYQEDRNVINSVLHQPISRSMRQRRHAMAGLMQATSLIETPDDKIYGEFHYYPGPLGVLTTEKPRSGVSHPLEKEDWIFLRRLSSRIQPQ